MEKTELTLALAKTIANAAEQEAVRNGWKVAIAILDAGGHLVYLERMDDVQFGSVEVAIQKAYTSAAFRRPTKALEDVVAGGRTAFLSLPGATFVQGGLPIAADGKVLGAVGVSGMQSAQDEQIAQAGLDAVARS